MLRNTTVINTWTSGLEFRICEDRILAGIIYLAQMISTFQNGYFFTS